MTHRFIVRAESMSYSKLVFAVDEMIAAGIDVDIWAMDTVFLGHALIAIYMTEEDIPRVQEFIWKHNNGRQVLANREINYEEEYLALGVDTRA
jgi:hypothetical protein